MNTLNGPIGLFHTTNLKVETALVTLGFEKVSTSRIIRATDGKESLVFWSKTTNGAGLSAAAIHHDMTKGGAALEREDHEAKLLAQLNQAQRDMFYKAVTNYLRTYAANRDTLIDEIKSTPRRVEVINGNKAVCIPENATNETKAAFSKYL